jgi:hypothetical protein
MSDALDSLDSLDALQPQQTQEAAALALDAEEPVLGPLGRRLVVALVVFLSIAFVVATVWLLGYLAYTTPPGPGGS